MVHDDTSSAALVLFDKEASVLVGSSCADLVEMVDKVFTSPL